MNVIILENPSDYIRGIMKRWFLEIKPNVFVGSLKTDVFRNVIAYIRRNSDGCPMLIMSSANNSQGFVIQDYNTPKRQLKKICGLDLISISPQENVDNSQ